MSQWRVDVTVMRDSTLCLPLVVEADSQSEAENVARALARLQLEREHPSTVDWLRVRYPDRFRVIEAKASDALDS